MQTEFVLLQNIGGRELLSLSAEEEISLAGTKVGPSLRITQLLQQLRSYASSYPSPPAQAAATTASSAPMEMDWVVLVEVWGLFLKGVIVSLIQHLRHPVSVSALMMEKWTESRKVPVRPCTLPPVSFYFHFELPAAEVSPSFTTHPSAEVSPSFTPYPSAEVSPSYTLHPSAEVSPSFTLHPSAEVSPSFTPHPSAEVSPSFTPQPSAEVSPSFTPHPSAEVSPSFTPHPSAEVSPSVTPHPSATVLVPPSLWRQKFSCIKITVAEDWSHQPLWSSSPYMSTQLTAFKVLLFYLVPDWCSFLGSRGPLTSDLKDFHICLYAWGRCYLWLLWHTHTKQQHHMLSDPSAHPLTPDLKDFTTHLCTCSRQLLFMTCNTPSNSNMWHQTDLLDVTSLWVQWVVVSQGLVESESVFRVTHITSFGSTVLAFMLGRSSH